MLMLAIVFEMQLKLELLESCTLMHRPISTVPSTGILESERILVLDGRL